MKYAYLTISGESVTIMYGDDTESAIILYAPEGRLTDLREAAIRMGIFVTVLPDSRDNLTAQLLTSQINNCIVQRQLNVNSPS